MNYSEVLFLIGRILYGGYFVMSGMNHFTKMGMMKGYAQSKGVPMPGLAIAGSGLLLLAGGLGVLLGAYVAWSSAAIVVFLIFVTPKMHNFWTATDPNMKMADMINFMKNMALLGAALMFLAIPSPWPYSL